MKLVPVIAILLMAVAVNSFAKDDEPTCEETASNVIPFRPRNSKPRIQEATTPVFMKVMIAKKQREKGQMPLVDLNVYQPWVYYEENVYTPDEFQRYVITPINSPGQKTLYSTRLSFQKILEIADRASQEHEKIQVVTRILSFNLKITSATAGAIASSFYNGYPVEDSRVAYLAELTWRLLTDNHVHLVVYDYDGEPMKFNITPARRR